MLGFGGSVISGSGLRALTGSGPRAEGFGLRLQDAPQKKERAVEPAPGPPDDGPCGAPPGWLWGCGVQGFG